MKKEELKKDLLELMKKHNVFISSKKGKNYPKELRFTEQNFKDSISIEELLIKIGNTTIEELK